MVNTVHGYSRLWRSHQCGASLSGRNRISVGRKSGLVKKGGDWWREIVGVATYIPFGVIKIVCETEYKDGAAPRRGAGG
ncbi:hypothetical protein EVAR_52923_1 [Eumeta japonica]|uniref:Uncharacterized protein n=1 Tax=Eumeta variegata TaxID=151549 RepID=A0A4C1Y4H9_EUMVA|nr:hypothetical protein EVAR_52923_1 [Eumeta japonica]